MPAITVVDLDAASDEAAVLAERIADRLQAEGIITPNPRPERAGCSAWMAGHRAEKVVTDPAEAHIHAGGVDVKHVWLPDRFGDPG